MIRLQTHSLLVSSLVLLLGFQAQCESEIAITKLQQLNKTEEVSPGNRQLLFVARDLDQAVRTFIEILPQLSFEPDYHAIVAANAREPDGTVSILATSNVALEILESPRTKQLKLHESTDPKLLAIELFWNKLNNAIDKNWQLIKVSANVSPPDGTPNAASGMDPKAIADPIQRQQYLDAIKQNQNNNLKNSQQSQLRLVRNTFLRGVAYHMSKDPESFWAHDNVIARFCKDPESKRILEEEYIKR